MAAAVSLAYQQIRALPFRPEMPPATASLEVRAVALPAARPPLRLAGAWELASDDPRFGGISALAIDRGGFLAVSDRGSIVRFDPPSAPKPTIWLADLGVGPVPWGKKWGRDAESLTPDRQGRGWWVGYEQVHSLWLYDASFERSLASIDLHRTGWRDNRGAEGLVVEGDHLLVAEENGREALRVRTTGTERLPLDAAGAEVAEAARAPDSSAWLLLRTKGWQGISQSIAPLVPTGNGYRTGPALPVPKGMFDNYEGMAIEPRPDGGWRFWLITDDGHRIMARTLLVALDYAPPGHDKSPATGAGLSKKSALKAP